VTIAEVTLINIFGNIFWRLWGPDNEAAVFSIDSMRSNLNPKVWDYEKGQGGDAFITEQVFHPFAGGMYFAAARSNNFNFYWSMFSSTFGAFQWKIMGERDSPSINDLVSTSLGGIVLGEIMHRLYIELNKGGSAAKIGAAILNPSAKINDTLWNYGPDEGSGKTHEASLTFGFSWLNARFLNNDSEAGFWNQGGAFIGFDLVYGNPFRTQGKIPFEQFDLNVSVTASIPLTWNLTLITDGYLASWLLIDDEHNQASNGLSLHLDNFITERDRIADLRLNTENLDFYANSLDYTIKWRHVLNKSFEFSLKTHIGFTPWVMANYNGGVDNDDHNLFLFGGNIKLFLELQQIIDNTGIKNGHALALGLCFYDMWSIPRTPGPENNTMFLAAKISYSFPISGRVSLFVANNFLLLHSSLTGNEGPDYPDITRWYNSAQAGVKITYGAFSKK
jgi:hypothetical protein